MMEFGKSLRAAREAKDYTIGQLAEVTHLAPSVIEDLEKEDFSHVAAPIYGRGFVKLYCEAVGLEPKPFIDEFMDILSGNHEPRIRERPVREDVQPPVPEPPPLPEAAPIPEPPPPPMDLFHQQEKSPEPVTPVAHEEANDAVPEKSLSRYATPFNTERPASPRNFWRLALLAVIALAVIALVLLGLKKLHDATTAPADTEEPPTEAIEQPAEQTAPPDEPTTPEPTTAKTPRSPQDIPSLYID